MFRILGTLFHSDIRAVSSWFTTQTGSKLTVVLGFLAVISGVGLFIYFGVRHVFFLLSPLGIYGSLTADYIMRVAYVIIAALGIGGSIAATANLMFSPGRNHFYLSTLPVPEKFLVIWLWLKTVISNWFFILLLLFPISLAHLHIFSASGLLPSLAVVIGLSAAMAVFTNSIGGFLAFLGTKVFRKYDALSTSISVTVFVVVLIWVFRLVLPPQMAGLTAGSPESFLPVYKSLPLVRIGFTFEYFILTTVLVTFLFLVVQIRSFLSLTREMSARMIAPQFVSSGHSPRIYTQSLDDGNPVLMLAVKDLLGIIRSPVEFSYGFFLLLLILGFFWLLSRVNISGFYLLDWVTYLIIFAYGGLMFFTNTYLLRFVYPLLAKESVSSWYLFSLPHLGSRIIHSKIITAFILCFPLLITSVVIWFLLPFVVNHQYLLAFSAAQLVLFIGAFQLFSGAIWPNFTDGDNPERVSTSSGGLLTLAVTSAVIILSACGMYHLLAGSLSGVKFLLAQSAFLAPAAAILYYHARRSVGRYQF